MTNNTPTPRKDIARFGTHGESIRVYVETGGELVRAQWREHGAPKKKSWPNTVANRAAAKLFARAWYEARTRSGDDAEIERLSLRDMWEKYTTAEFPHLRRKSIVNYTHHWKQWEIFAGRTMFADQVSAETLDGYRAYLVGRKLAISQQQAAIALVKIVFRWALRRELLKRDRISLYSFKVAKEQRTKAIPEYTRDEYTRLLAAFDPRLGSQWRAWVLTAFVGEQGPRINAALHLQWQDVDFTTRPEAPFGTVHWRPEWDKLGRDRVQPLTAAARDALFVALGWSAQYRDRTDWIFPSVRTEVDSTSDGTYTEKSFLWMLHEGETRAGVKYIPRRGAHSLRRMAMGNALAVSKNVVDAMWWIGDTDLRQARKYATERDARMGEMSTMLGAEGVVRTGDGNAAPTIKSARPVEQTVPKPSPDGEKNNAPESAGALSTTTTRS